MPLLRIPEIRPISDLARDARAVVERARERQEPIVITQRGVGVAVLLPIELYREMEKHRPRSIPSIRLANPADAERFRMTVTELDGASEP